MCFIQLREYGVDVPMLCGFAVGAICAWGFNFAVKKLHVSQIKKLIRHEPEKRLCDIDAEFAQLMNDFDMEFAALIGKTERLLYVYSVMVSRFEVVGGWLVLKAFFGWLESRSGPEQEADQKRASNTSQMSAYHVYLYGNALSLLLGLLCGVLGNSVRIALTRVIG